MEEISDISAKTTFYVRRSVITIQLVAPRSVDGKSVIKSIEMSVQILSGIGKGFSKSCFCVRQIVFWLYGSQFPVKIRIWFDASGQKNLRDKIAYPLSRPEYAVV